MFRSLTKCKSVATALVFTILVGAATLAPLNHRGEVQQAHALIVHDPGNAAINRANVVVNSISQTLQNAFYIKEFTLDGIANGLAKTIVKSMVASIVNWINSGFQGSPAFVTDLREHILGQLDQAAGQFIYNDPSLNFLCSPFQLDVKVALATSYREVTRESLSEAQCTLSDVSNNIEGFLNGSFNDGGWQSWFELTQKPANTPTGARLAAEGEMYARLIDEEGKTVKELDWGDGFLSFKVCADTDNQKNCDITTPGRVIADQLNKSLGAGQDALITADEINEIISALFAQLAQQALTGINGLLGLSSSGGGGGGVNPLTPPCPGNGSYLDGLCNASESASGILDPFETAIQREIDNQALQTQIITRVNTVENALNAAQSSGCMSGQTLQSLSPILVRDRNQAQTRLILDNQHLTYLRQKQAEFLTASAQTQLDLVTELNAKSQDGSLTTLTDNVNTDLYIQFEFNDEAVRVEGVIQTAVRRCNGGGGGNN